MSTRNITNDGISACHWTPQPITILYWYMGVIPKGSGLIWNREIVQKRVICGDGALGDEGSTVCPIGMVLNHAMPILTAKISTFLGKIRVVYTRW
jgi:hypothetical protein